ncbi:MAG: tetratricopeptide repeat protein [Isosphaeraceae bacterium]|jgi:tetratricopeptide (TPR) repeat protein
MSRRALVQIGLVLVGVMWIGTQRTTVRADEDPRTALRFLQELRDHGLHDLALQFIDELRVDPGAPADLKVVLDYQEGRTEIDEAAKTGDLAHRRDLLEQAHTKLESFVKAQPNHPLAREALVQGARLLVERGHLALLLADDAQDPAQKTLRQTEARASFAQAREAFARAVEQLELSYKSFSGFIAKGDPRLDERTKVYSSLLDAKLQRAVIDYELAQTYPANSSERAGHLAEALKQFDALYKDYRTQMAGLTAQMWQAKCYEEQGKIGEAIGIYKLLLEQPDPRLRPLQRFVGYFHIVALAKRKDYALAADEAARWLEKYSRREEIRSQEGLGVLLELARNIDAQMGQATSKAERQQATKRIVDAVSQVVRHASPYKNDALALLKKYKPAAAARTEELARLSYDDAMGQADESIASRDWERAIALYKAAERKADPRREIDKASRARYNLSFCYYMNKQFYESNVLAEHLARRYPQGGLSPKAAEIGMQALADAYNTYNEVDRGADLERLIDLAKYTAATWPDREQGDDAHINLGMIYQGRGQYDQAIAEFAAVRDRSPKKIEAQTRLGAAHWAKSRMLDRRGDKEKAAAESKAAIDLLEQSLKARQAAGAAATDAGLIGDAADLAVALTETGKPADAIKLLDPISKAQTTRTGPSYARLMEATLLAQINSGLVEPAIVSMKALEQSGSTASRVQLYYKLGKLLERELDRLRATKDSNGLKKTQQDYRSFLTALSESQSGQTYESLQWAGASLLELDAGSDAEKVLRRVLNDAIGNPTFLNQPGGPERILRTKVKLAAALRSQGITDRKKLDEAASIVEELLSQNPRRIEPLVEKGMLLESQAQAVESQAQAGQGEWSAACQHWQDLAQKLSRTRPRPLAYFDAWYHAAYALHQQNENTKARQTLNGIMRLNPGVGSPEMKSKYEQLLKSMK